MRHLLKAVLLAASSFVAFPAHAQEELVVTATRLANEAERLPADVDVIDVDEARGRGVSSLADALRESPGIHAVQSGGFGGQTSIFSGGANSNHTLVLFDGVRLNDPSSPSSAFDAGQDTLGGLTRIEVVQGPMSAVYGSDAIGGVINMLPRRGGEGPLNAQLDLAGGTFETLTATAAIDGTLGAFRYAVTAEGYATAGHDLVPERMNTHTGDEDAAESATFTGVFDLALSQAISLDLLVRQRQARADFDAFPYTIFWEEYRADDTDIEMARNDLTLARLGGTWRLSETLSLRASGGSLTYQREERDGGAATSIFDGERSFGDVTAHWRPNALGPFANAGIVAGVETETEEVDIVTPFTGIVADQDRTGGFITAQGDLGALTLVAAVRVDDFEGFGTQDTWRVGASYRLGDSANLYANFGTAFRAPTLNERFDPTYGNAALEAEEAQGWEAGANLWFGAFGQARGLELGALYRQTDVDNLVSYASTAPYGFINIDEAELQSAEARMTLRPFAWLTGALSYVHTEAENGVTGAQLARRPEQTWTASVATEHGPLTTYIAWRHVGEQRDRLYGDDGFFIAAGDIPAYGLLDASVRWRLHEGAELYLAGRNLTDESYESPGAFAGASRNFTLGVRLRAKSN